jgi:hypothetical protein
MMTGRYPFEFDEEGNLLALYDKIIAAQFDILPEIEADEDLKDLICGMRNYSPYTTISKLSSAYNF